MNVSLSDSSEPLKKEEEEEEETSLRSIHCILLE